MLQASECKWEKDRHTFALFELHGHDTRDHTAEIAAMDDVAFAEAEADHELVEYCGGIFACPFSLQWWTGRESVAGK